MATIGDRGASLGWLSFPAKSSLAVALGVCKVESLMNPLLTLAAVEITVGLMLIIAAMIVAIVSIFVQRHPLLQIAVILICVALLIGR